MKYEVQVINAQGKAMSNTILFESKEEMLDHIRSRSKRTNGVGYIRLFPDNKNAGMTIVDYGSHSLFYRFKIVDTSQ